MAPGMVIKVNQELAHTRYEVWCDSPECGLHTTERTLDEARDRVDTHRSMHDLLGIMDRAAKR